MKRIVLCLSLLAASLTGALAQPAHLWARQPAKGESTAEAVVTDRSGNVYSIGSYISAVDLDPGTGTQTATSNGGNDVYLSKLDASGSLLWAKSFGSTSDDLGMALALDDSGNVYATGEFKGTVDFDPGPGTANLTSTTGSNGSPNSALFLLKLNPQGNYVWARSLSGTGSTYPVEPSSVQSDPAGNCYLGGIFRGTVDFDPGAGNYPLSTATASTVSSFLLKINANGSFAWAKKIDTKNADNGGMVCLGASGTLYSTGNFLDSADFDPGPGTAMRNQNNGRAYVLSLDTAGNFRWVKNFGGTSALGYGIAQDRSRNLLVTGTFNNTADFDPGPGTANLTNGPTASGFACKLSDTGGYVWAKTLASSPSALAFAYRVTTDLGNNVLLAGHFSGTNDFDPGAGTTSVASNGSSDIFVSKFSPAGDFIWVHAFGGTSTEIGTAISLDRSGSALVSGKFHGKVDFDPGTATDTLNANPAQYSGFLDKLQLCQRTASRISVTACRQYTAPSGRIYGRPGVYEDTLVNASGCDSVLTIALSFTVDTGVGGHDDTLISRMYYGTAPATYQWLDCDANLALVPGATSGIFSPAAGGHFAVAITSGGCTDTSGCHRVVKALCICGPGRLQQAKLYPNPTSGTVYLDFGTPVPTASARVLDYQGRLIRTVEIRDERRTELQLPSVPGLYFVELQDGLGQLQVFKVSVR